MHFLRQVILLLIASICCGFPGTGRKYTPPSGSLADITFVGANQVGNSSSSTSITINKPAGLAAGNLILIFIAIKSGGPGPYTPPTGFTELLGPGLYGVGGISISNVVFKKIAGSSEPASYTFSWTNSSQASGAILVYSGVDTTDPFGAYGFGNTPDSTSTTVTAPSLNTTSDKAMLLGIFCMVLDSSLTLPVELTSRSNIASSANPSSNRIRMAIGERVVPSSGASGSSTGTAGAPTSMTGWHIWLRPAAL